MPQRAEQTAALLRAHRPVVEVEGEIADGAVFPVADIAVGTWLQGRVDRYVTVWHSAKSRRQHLRRWQLDASQPVLGRSGLQMGEPHRAVDGPDAHRAVP